MVEVSFALGRLLRQNVAVESVLSLDFTGARQSETLFGGAIGLYLWHGFEKI